MSRPTNPFTVAAVEFNPEIFELERNIERACAVIDEAATNGARLIVMPEAALSGYIYRDLEQFRPYLDTVPGKGTDAIAKVTARHRCYVAIGIAEIDEATGLTYNTGALIGPDGYLGKYRKNGLNPSDIDWFTPGNTGYPVFDTDLGRIAMVICYDDTYWEPARLPLLKGADLIAYICASDRLLPPFMPNENKGAHSTIAAVQQLVAWNGLAMVAADRNNAETNPTTGITVTYGGSASIWQATGERIAHAPATDYANTISNPGQILYGQIDPALFDNDQKRTVARRRPELYRPLAFFRAPVDPRATKAGQRISATALQYRTVAGDLDGNVGRLMTLVQQLEGTLEPGLVVLPAFSLSGRPTGDADAHAWAESGVGRTVQVLGDIAARLRSHVVGSHVERDGDRLFHACVLVSPQGTVVGSYRQVHELLVAYGNAGGAVYAVPGVVSNAVASNADSYYRGAIAGVGLWEAKVPASGGSDVSGALMVRRKAIAIGFWTYLNYKLTDPAGRVGVELMSWSRYGTGLVKQANLREVISLA